MASVAGCLVADAFASARMSANPGLAQEAGEMHGQASITIQVPREELAARWREFEQERDGDARLGPIEVLGGDPDSGIPWRTAEGAGESARGVTRLRDAPGGRGSEIHISVDFDVPGGSLGRAVKKVAGDEPLQRVRDDLRRLKQRLETGEIARSEGAPAGPTAKAQPKQRPAQPLAHATN
jgi:uncharacterized membrane protein